MKSQSCCHQIETGIRRAATAVGQETRRLPLASSPVLISLLTPPATPLLTDEQDFRCGDFFGVRELNECEGVDQTRPAPIRPPPKKRLRVHSCLGRRVSSPEGSEASTTTLPSTAAPPSAAWGGGSTTPTALASLAGSPGLRPQACPTSWEVPPLDVKGYDSMSVEELREQLLGPGAREDDVDLAVGWERSELIAVLEEMDRICMPVVQALGF